MLHVEHPHPFLTIPFIPSPTFTATLYPTPHSIIHPYAT